jgi:cytosine/adenosine deaminase-related metal-dependent hydrolase
VRPGRGGVELLRRRGAALVWCPTSNLHLYGATAPAELFDTGIDVLLGTDSLLSGDGTLLDELRVARGLGRMDDARLLGSIGATAARRLGLPAPTLEVGAAADVVVLRRPIWEARPRDVALVLVDGVPRFGDAELAELFERSGVGVERLSVGGVEKLVVAPLARVAERVRALSPEAARILD